MWFDTALAEPYLATNARPRSEQSMTARRLLTINALIRIGAAGSGQLFAFLLAERMARDTARGALLVGMIGAAFFLTELVGAPFAGRTADRVGQGRVLRWGPVFGVVSALVAALAALGAGHSRISPVAGS